MDRYPTIGLLDRRCLVYFKKVGGRISVDLIQKVDYHNSQGISILNGTSLANKVLM